MRTDDFPLNSDDAAEDPEAEPFDAEDYQDAALASLIEESGRPIPTNPTNHPNQSNQTNQTNQMNQTNQINQTNP